MSDDSRFRQCFVRFVRVQWPRKSEKFVQLQSLATYHLSRDTQPKCMDTRCSSRPIQKHFLRESGGDGSGGGGLCDSAQTYVENLTDFFLLVGLLFQFVLSI